MVGLFLGDVLKPVVVYVVHLNTIQMQFFTMV